MTKAGGSAPLGSPALQALQPKYTKDWSPHPPPIACRDQEHGDISWGFPSVFGLSSPTPDLLPMVFLLLSPTCCDLGEKRARGDGGTSVKAAQPSGPVAAFTSPHVPGGASRAEQSNQGCPQAPALPWAGCASSEQSPSIQPVLGESSSPTVTENTGPAPAGAFGTGTSQSITCMFGDALL